MKKATKLAEKEMRDERRSRGKRKKNFSVKKKKILITEGVRKTHESMKSIAKPTNSIMNKRKTET